MMVNILDKIQTTRSGLGIVLLRLIIGGIVKSKKIIKENEMDYFSIDLMILFKGQ